MTPPPFPMKRCSVVDSILSVGLCCPGGRDARHRGRVPCAAHGAVPAGIDKDEESCFHGGCLTQVTCVFTSSTSVWADGVWTGLYCPVCSQLGVRFQANEGWFPHCTFHRALCFTERPGCVDGLLSLSELTDFRWHGEIHIGNVCFNT